MNSKRTHIINWTQLKEQADWSVAVLARKRGVSVRTLERFFRKRMPKSPKSWLLEQRQLRAIELLQDGCSVKETAALLGYIHADHFSHEFKKHWGRSPTKKMQSLSTTGL